MYSLNLLLFKTDRSEFFFEGEIEAWAFLRSIQSELGKENVEYMIGPCIWKYYEKERVKS